MSVDDPNRPSDLPERPEPPKPSVRKRWRYFTRRHAILAGLIAVVAVTAITLLGGSMTGFFNTLGSALTGAGS